MLLKIIDKVYRVLTCTGKPEKMREIFPVMEKSGNFKILSESQGIFYQRGKVRSENNKIILWGKSKKSCFQT